jgi:hypothetical protein
MAGGTCGDIPFWNAILENLFAGHYQFPGSATNRFGAEAVEFSSNGRYLHGTENMGDAEHDVICPSPLDEGSQLIFDILDLLSGKTRDRIIPTIALARRSVAVLAIPNLGRNVVSRNSGLGVSWQ